MGWGIGYDHHWNRDVGYGVPAYCDHPGCGKKIDRGLGFICGGDVGGGEQGCGLFFCEDHLAGCPTVCERCANDQLPFGPTPDHPHWMRWKLTDESWQKWRSQNPAAVEAMAAALARKEGESK